jgi:outer membrane protein OmpA-like peptidoglycan-associated protein
MIKNLLFAASFLIINLGSLAAQELDNYDISYSAVSKQLEQQLLNKANKGISYKKYDEAIKNYSDVLRADSASFLGNYAIAITLYENFQQPKSISFFERALRHSKAPVIEAYFFIANSYHLSSDYDKAEQNFKTYLSLFEQDSSFFSAEEKENAKKNISHRIEMCENGKRLSLSKAENSPLYKSGKKITISSIDNKINSKYDDFGSVFLANDSTLYFTSSRGGDKGDIYVSYLENNNWGKVESVDWPINTNGYEAVINTRSDENRLYFYRSENEDAAVYYSDYLQNHWGAIEPLLNKSETKGIFKDTRIFSFAESPAKDELFIISDRKGGAGGKDIYVSKKTTDSTWGALENMGVPINTPYDEVALSLGSDGNTMYFSSNGDKSIGGFDVFVIHRDNGKWSEPISLGAPINTAGDDLFFSFLHNSNRASYSSSANGAKSTRDLDIYYVDFCDDVKENTIKGLTTGFSTGTITVTEVLSQKEITTCSIKDGNYSMDLKVGKRYRFAFQTEGIKPVYMFVTVPEPTECKRYDIYQEIIFNKPGDTLKVKSALLDIAYEKNNPDIRMYSALLDKEDKSTLKNYSENNLLTYPAEVLKTSINTVVYDTASGKTLSKISFDDKLLNAEKGKMKETYDKELAKSITSTTAKTITTFSFNNILFDFDKSKIKEQYKAELDKAVTFLSDVKPDSKIEIDGYTDSKGNAKHNRTLSKQRANAVARYLISKKINKNRITVVGYGETKPIAPNKNPNGTDSLEGRSKNRRTEIVIK